MFNLYQHDAPANLHKVVDGNNNLWGILCNVDLSKCTLYNHNFAAICRSRSSSKIVLYKAMQSCFDFTIWGTVCHNQSVEDCIVEGAEKILGEKPQNIKYFGSSSPKDAKSNFVSYYEIHYSENFIKNVICGGDLSILDIGEFHNLCAYFPKDVSPLLRETASTVYGLFHPQN